MSLTFADQFGNFTYSEDKDSTLTITGYPTNAVGSVVIPAMILGKPVTGIGYAAFSNCSGLTEVTIPNSVTRIEAYAFQSCTALSGMTLPAGVTIVDGGAFANCRGLNSFSVDPENPSYSTEGGVLMNKLKTTLVVCPASRQGVYSVPGGVTRIEDFAFAGCRDLTGVTFPAGVSQIGNGAFSGCRALTNMTIPPGVTSIGEDAFNSCRGLKSVTIPAGVSQIGNGTFSGCHALTSVTIPPGVTSIGTDAFDSCLGLKSVSIPSSVTAIGLRAFSGCVELTGITLPAGVVSIQAYAFAYCRKLTGVIIPSGVISLGGGAFYDCEGLKAAVFTGNAPAIGVDSIVFDSTAPGFTVYYFDGKTGFTSPTWWGYPAVNMGAAAPVKAWLAASGLPYDSNLQSDPNNDGVNLLMAYALNLDPNKNLAGSMPQPVLAAGKMSLSFYAGTAGVTYMVEASSNMAGWSPDGVSISAPDTNQIRTATVGTTGAPRFMRLAVSH